MGKLILNDIPQYDQLERPNLFSSQLWLDAWSQTFEAKFDSQSKEKIADAFACGDMDVYLIKEPLLRIFPVNTVYPAGLISRKIAAFRSEYFQFPFPVNSLTAWNNFWSGLEKSSWQRLMINDILKDSIDHQQLIKQAAQRNYSVFVKETEPTFGVNTFATSFDDYLKSLGKNTRLKLFGRRKRLEEMGAVTIKNYVDQPEIFFTILEKFHSSRWGNPLSESKKKFVKILLSNAKQANEKQENVAIDLSVLSLNDEPISVAFDIRWGNRVYNLQLGYRDNFSSAFSIGTLHLGYQIEAAFKNPDIYFYDFMAGRGKNSNYKASLANSQAHFVQLVIVRGAFLSGFYRLKALADKLGWGRWRKRSAGDVNPTQDNFPLGASDLPQIAGVVLQGLLC